MTSVVNYFIKNFIERKANANITAFYRIVFSVLNIFLITRYFQFFDVVWSHINYTENIIFLKTLLSLWMVISVFLMLGFGGRWVGFLQLLFSAFIMTNVYTNGIFELTHLVSSWVFVLARTDTKFSVNNFLLRQNNLLRHFSCPYSHSPVLPLFIIGWYFGLVFLYAGLDKLSDPLWLKGDGFYAFCVLPWTLPAYLKGIADIKWLVIFCNYAALAIEIGFFFFFLFGKTRFWAVLFFFLLALGLVYPFNIFFIGLYAANFAFLLFAATGKYSSLQPANIPESPSRKNKFLLAATGVVLVCLSCAYFISMYNNFSAHFTQLSAEDKIIPPQFNVEALKHCQEYKQCLLFPPKAKTAGSEFRSSFSFEGRRQPVQFLNKWFIRCGPVGLFSSMHLMGQYAYRVTITTIDNKIVEPVHYFEAGKSRGEFDRQILMLNIFQGAMYPLGDVTFKLSKCIYPRPRETQFLYRFILYSLSKVNSNEVRYVSLLSAPMKVPYTYQGQVKQVDNDWAEIVRYDVNTKLYKYNTIPHAQPFQARNPFLPDYLHRFLWKQMHNQ